MAGWLLVGGIAAVYDVYAIRTKRCETLSCVAGRHPFASAAVLIGLGIHFNTHRLSWRSRP